MRVGVARGHVVVEVALTPEDVKRMVERGTFIYLMSHGYAENFGESVRRAAEIARAEREQIEAVEDETTP